MASIERIHQLWKNQSHPLLNERDYMNMAYELAIRKPSLHDSIIDTQRNRLSNPDRLREFDFISKSVTPDTLKMDECFQSLMKAENRRIEPWAASALSYLNHPQRGDRVRRKAEYALPRGGRTAIRNRAWRRRIVTG